MGPFEFGSAQRILFGRGKLSELPTIAAGYGTRALLVAGSHLERTGERARIEAMLGSHGIAVSGLSSRGEPEVQAVDRAAEAARAFRAEVVVAVGGGATLDLGKAAAGLATNGGSVREYLEGVGTGRALSRPGLPFIAVPSTAGTGSEVTRNAVVASKAEGFKKSIRSPLLLPAVALVDPALTDALPPAETAASGLDALTQLIEPFVSLRAFPITDALALEGVRLAVRGLGPAYRGQPGQPRDDLALAALLGGLCLANAGLGAVHGIAAALGARYEIPHGYACACVLVRTMEANLAALEARDPDGPALARYARLGEVLAGRAFSSSGEARAAAVEVVRALAQELGVPGLSRFGVKPAEVLSLVPESRGSSMKTNPISLLDEEIEGILRGSL